MNNIGYFSPSSQNNLPMSSSTPNNNEWKKGAPRCSRCCSLIYDPTLVSADDKFWHKSCFRCTYCHGEMNDDCFSNGKDFYCRQDFERLFGLPCAGCSVMMDPSEVVRRVYCNVYHEQCFVCAICNLPLQTGDKVYLRDDNKLVCSEDYEKIHGPVSNRHHDAIMSTYPAGGDRLAPHVNGHSHSIVGMGAFLSDPKLSPQMRHELNNIAKSDKSKSRSGSCVGEWLNLVLSPDSVPPNVDLTPEDIRNGEVCVSSILHHQGNPKSQMFDRTVNWMCS